MRAVECEIDYDYFFSKDITWREFSIRTMGYEQRQLREDVRARNLYYMIYAMNTGDKVKKTAQQLWPLALDEKKDRGKELSPEQLQRMLKLYGSNRDTKN